jgi:hypothetical protein
MKDIDHDRQEASCFGVKRLDATIYFARWPRTYGQCQPSLHLWQRRILTTHLLAA